MALSTQVLKRVCDEISGKYLPSKVSKVRSQDSFEFTLCLDSATILISLDKALSRLHVVTKPSSPHKLFWFAKELMVLEGATLSKLSCHDTLPIITLTFEKEKLQLVCELTTHPKAYLLNDKGTCLKSTNKKAFAIYSYPQTLEMPEATLSPPDIESWANAIKEQKQLTEEKDALKKVLAKKITTFDRALQNAESSLEKSKCYKDAEHTAELVKAHYGQLKKGLKEIKVSDWTKDNLEIAIPIDPKKSPKEVLEDLFTKSHKLQKAIIPLQEHIASLVQDRARWKKTLDELDSINSQDALEELKCLLGILPQEAKKPSAKKTLYHTFYSEMGLPIFVGKNSESNHILTFQVARGRDLWLHAHSVSGAHVVVQKQKEQEIDNETMQDALQLALYHSKARTLKTGHHEVLVTEQKYVSRTPSMPKGKVLVSKHKIMNCALDLQRIEKIKSRLPHSSRNR